MGSRACAFVTQSRSEHDSFSRHRLSHQLHDMRYTTDVLIAGAGLAGSCAALHLRMAGREVMVVEAEEPAAGSAAGLVNPFMGRKAKPVPYLHEAVNAFEETLKIASAEHLFFGDGVWRPAMSESQAITYRRRAKQHPDQLTWLPHDDARDRFAPALTSFGGLWVRRGGAISVPSFIRALLDAAHVEVRPNTLVSRWDEDKNHVAVTLNDGTRLHARHLILALGYGGVDHPALSDLELYGVKGQVIRVETPVDLASLPPLAGSGYVVPDGDTLVIGSTYEHNFTVLDPTGDATEQILEKAGTLLPSLTEPTVVEAATGVRTYARGSSEPVARPLSGSQRIWAFTGLGSKGLLMAPLFARRLCKRLTGETPA